MQIGRNRGKCVRVCIRTREIWNWILFLSIVMCDLARVIRCRLENLRTFARSALEIPRTVHIYCFAKLSLRVKFLRLCWLRALLCMQIIVWFTVGSRRYSLEHETGASGITIIHVKWPNRTTHFFEAMIDNRILIGVKIVDRILLIMINRWTRVRLIVMIDLNWVRWILMFWRYLYFDLYLCLWLEIDRSR